MSKDELVNRLAAAARHIPTADVARVLKTFAHARVELAKTERDIIKIEATRDMLIAEMNLKYGVIQAALGEIFAERRGALDRHFKVIERGLESNDRDLIVAGLTGVANIVGSSPFADLDRLGQLLNSGSSIEI
jgi:hypothetical protein